MTAVCNAGVFLFLMKRNYITGINIIETKLDTTISQGWIEVSVI